METYAYTRVLAYDFETALAKTEEALAQQQFGIITRIDVKETFKKKLDIDYANYIILGACNPMSAKKALDAEKEVGLLLPCNVIVYQDGQEVKVSAIKPSIAMSISSHDELCEIANIIEAKLKKAIDSI